MRRAVLRPFSSNGPRRTSHYYGWLIYIHLTVIHACNFVDETILYRLEDWAAVPIRPNALIISSLADKIFLLGRCFQLRSIWQQSSHRTFITLNYMFLLFVLLLFNCGLVSSRQDSSQLIIAAKWDLKNSKAFLVYSVRCLSITTSWRLVFKNWCNLDLIFLTIRCKLSELWILIRYKFAHWLRSKASIHRKPIIGSRLSCCSCILILEASNLRVFIHRIAGACRWASASEALLRHTVESWLSLFGVSSIRGLLSIVLQACPTIDSKLSNLHANILSLYFVLALLYCSIHANNLWSGHFTMACVW